MADVVIKARRRPFESLRAQQSLRAHVVCDRFIGS
jgi:hypothetical protein